VSLGCTRVDAGHVLSTVDTLSSQRHLLNDRLGTVDQVMAA